MTSGLVMLSVLAAVWTAPAAAHTRHRLSYHQAKHAALKRGNREARKRHTKAKLDSLIRTGPRDYDAEVHWRWTDPHGCQGCGYDPDTGQFYDTPSKRECDADIKVHRYKRSGRIRARIDSESCF